MCLSLNAVFQLGFCDIMEPHVRKRWRYTVPQVRLWQTVCVCIPMKKDITSCSANKVKRPESLFFPGIYWIFQKVKMSFIHETKESHNIGLK